MVADENEKSCVQVQPITSTRVIVTFRYRFGAFSGGKRWQTQQLERTWFGGDAQSRTEIHGFASRWLFMYFYELQALPRRMTCRQKIYLLITPFFMSVMRKMQALYEFI